MLEEHAVRGLHYLFPSAKPVVDYVLTNAPLTPEDTEPGPLRISQWHLPDPQPSDETINAAIALYDAAQAQRQADATALRNQVLSLASGAVGKPLNTLVAGEVRALVAILLWQAGGVTGAGIVRPLAEWVKE